jgi:hypothetical protein
MSDCTGCTTICAGVCVSDVKECCYGSMVWCPTAGTCVASLADCACDPLDNATRCLDLSGQTECVQNVSACTFACELCPFGSNVDQSVCVPPSEIDEICCGTNSRWCPEYESCIYEYSVCGTCQEPNVYCYSNNFCMPSILPSKNTTSLT